MQINEQANLYTVLFRVICPLCVIVSTVYDFQVVCLMQRPEIVTNEAK